jgi:2-oxo-3-hexenedioate decarboxylase
MDDQLQNDARISVIADRILWASARGVSIDPISFDQGDLDLGAAYAIAAAVRRHREARGERVIGRKIGFTNRTIWPEYGVYAPIWGYVYDTTVRRIADLGGPFGIGHLVEPRIEPEIIFKLARAPEAGMDEQAMLSCIEWVAHGFEIVQSIFPGWRFQAADTVAAFGLHGALLVGEPEPVTPATMTTWYEALSGFRITLERNGTEQETGCAGNVLTGGPLSALRHLVELLAISPASPPLGAGEIISTGTLTRALPIEPGETWSTKLDGVPLTGISARFGTT